MQNQEESSTLGRYRNAIAKRFWTGAVAEGPISQRVGGDLSDAGGSSVYRRSSSVSKDDNGLRRGSVPEHIASPQKGKPRPFDPFELRRLAETETVQAVIDGKIADVSAIPWRVVPIDEDASPSDSVIADAEEALADPNPNPEQFDDVNGMFLRDALETGNFASTVNLHVDGRRAEVNPLDPNTFTAEWDRHRIIQGFYQYPHAKQRWGDPEAFDPDELMWGVYNPETTRAGFYGHSPVEKLRSVIEVMGGIVEKEHAELEEGMPSGMLVLGDEWNSNDYDSFRDYWDAEVKGNQHKVPHAHAESAEFVRFSPSYADLQLLDRQKWYAKLVGAVFQTPISETGLAIGESMTRATDVSQRQRYKQRGLRPELSLLEDVWTYQYLHRFWSDQLKIEFDPGLDIIEKKEIANINSVRLSNGTRTVNELREEEGRDPVPWGDEPFDLRSYARSQGGGGLFDDLGIGGGAGGPDGGDAAPGDDGSTIEEQNQAALTEGLEQERAPTQDGDGGDGGDGANFRDAATATASTSASKSWASTEGTWLPPAPDHDHHHNHVEKADDDPLRSTDHPQQFSFQPSEIEALRRDVEDVFSDYITSVLNQVRGNQQLLRTGVEKRDDPDDADPVGIEKSTPAFMRLIREEIGIEFAEDTAEILTEHKSEKVLDGEDDILSELSQAGLSVEDVDLEQTRRRVVERIGRRTLKVTKPISDRLEGDLREVLADGWRNGDTITEIESAIEGVTEKWQGYEAERLARDQLGRASKEGRTAYARDTAGEVGGWERTWLSTGDSRTRESHTDMDGKTVGQNEPWVVNYAPDGGPARVEEDYPGDSVYGIQCRCDFKLSPAGLSESVQKWAENPTRRMQELELEQDRPIDAVLMAAELGPESRSATIERLDVGRSTYYRWLKESGLYDR